MYSQNNWGIRGDIAYGFMLPHHKSMQFLIKEHAYSASLGVKLKFENKNYWLNEWRIPELSVNYYFASPGNKDIFGYTHSLLANLNIPLYTNKYNEFFYIIGLGVGYITKAFNKENNYYQTVISSNLNAHLRLGLGYAYLYRKDKSQVRLQLLLDHFSNAKFYAPNLGINMVTVGMGFSHGLDSSYVVNQNLDKDFISPRIKSKWYSNLNLSLGLKQNAAYDENHFVIINISPDCFYNINNKRSLGLGTDITYDNSIHSYYLNSTGEIVNKTFRLGIHLAQELYFGDLILYMQVGSYIVNPKPDDGYIYNRIIVKYPIYKNLLAGIGLKTHLSVADCLQFNLSYRIEY